MRQCHRPKASGTPMKRCAAMVKRGYPTPLSFRMLVLAQGRGLVSEEADHARLLISAKRHDPRLAFTTPLRELLPSASCC